MTPQQTHALDWHKRLAALVLAALALAPAALACSSSQGAELDGDFYLDEDAARRIVRRMLDAERITNVEEDVGVTAEAYDGKVFYRADFVGNNGVWLLEVATSPDDDIDAWQLDFYPDDFDPPVHRRVVASGRDEQQAKDRLEREIRGFIHWIQGRGLVG